MEREFISLWKYFMVWLIYNLFTGINLNWITDTRNIIISNLTMEQISLHRNTNTTDLFGRCDFNALLK